MQAMTSRNPEQSNIRIERLGASGLEIHVPPEVARAPRMARTACLFAAIFLGFTALWVWVVVVYRLPIIVRILFYCAAVPFAVVDFILLVAAINSLLRRFRIEIDSDALTVSDYWLFLRWQKNTIPLGDITKVEYRAPGSVNQKPYYSLLVHHRRDSTPHETTLATAIADEREAEWLVDEISAALPNGRKP